MWCSEVSHFVPSRITWNALAARCWRYQFHGSSTYARKESHQNDADSLRKDLSENEAIVKLLQQHNNRLEEAESASSEAVGRSRDKLTTPIWKSSFKNVVLANSAEGASTIARRAAAEARILASC